MTPRKPTDKEREQCKEVCCNCGENVLECACPGSFADGPWEHSRAAMKSAKESK